MESILKTYTIADLKKMIKEKKLNGYSKFIKKNDIIKFMTKPTNLNLFSDIKSNKKNNNNNNDDEDKPIKFIVSFD